MMEIPSCVGLLVIQPTPFCNLDCDYCYLPNRNDTRKISATTLECVIERVFESVLLGERLTIVWHAGEPLILPISFYDMALDLIRERQPQRTFVEHSIQTNAVLINENWCKFIRDRGIKIGVSIDGPQFLHDKHRKTRSGKGSHTQTVKGIRLLQDNGVDFHVITVLTRESLQYPDELFDFYSSNDIGRIGFNIEEIEGVNRTTTLADRNVHKEFARFIRRFYDLVHESGGGISVREFDNLSRSILSSVQRPIYNQQVTPFGIVSADCEGNISTFSPELLGQSSKQYDDFKFCNARRETLSSIHSKSAFQRLSYDIRRGVRRCQDSCAYFSICGGGAPANKFYESGSFDVTETLHCRLTKKILTDLLLSEIESRTKPMKFRSRDALKTIKAETAHQ